MDKTIRKNPDPKEQQADVYRYWRSLSPGERLKATWELSLAAYRMKGIAFDEERPPRTLVRIYREPRPVLKDAEKP